jgi:hypothetical protein
MKIQKPLSMSSTELEETEKVTLPMSCLNEDQGVVDSWLTSQIGALLG